MWHSGGKIVQGHTVQSDRYASYRFVRMDLQDKAALERLFEVEKFDAVMNLAAQAGVRYSIENPLAYIDSNIVGLPIFWKRYGTTL
mgnify:CR=1 FL=1